MWGINVLTVKISHLITSSTAGLHKLRVVPPTINLSMLEKVDMIDKQLTAMIADETLWMPAFISTTKLGEYTRFPTADIGMTVIALFGHG